MADVLRTINPKLSTFLEWNLNECIGYKSITLSGTTYVSERQDTLLVEYKNKRKTNRLIDHRIGENDPSASFEDKMLERFATENKRHHEKASLFNIDDEGDEEFGLELTHKGESLRQIEKFEKPTDSDEDDEDDVGNLKGDIVSEGHFGGGILQKKSDVEQEKTWKDRMDEMIAKSKMAKHERQSAKDELVQMTDQLDDQWRELHNVVATIKRKDDEDEQNHADDFDIAVNELKYESRGTPTDRLKTEAEVAKIEKARLEKLEKERLMRMRGEQNKSRTHHSADDLDDGMDYGLDDQEEFEVMYKDGKLLSNNSTADDSEDDEGDESGEEAASSEEEEEEGESGEESEEEDQYSDLESGTEDEGDAEVEINAPPTKRHKRNTNKVENDAELTRHIPYTFSVPDSYTSLIELLDRYNLVEQNVVVERMRKCNHASLAVENREHLVRLYGFLLEYFGDISLRVPVPITLIDHLTVHLYEMAKQFPQQTAQHSKHIITERQRLFSLYCQSKNGRGTWPFMDLLMYFKLFAHIYPTSDFRHEVITPAIIFASQIFTSCPVTNHRDVAVGLMLTTIMAEYVSFSKAVVPECVNFLSALTHTSLPSDSNKVVVGTTTCRSNLLRCKACGNELKSRCIKPFNLNAVIARGVGNSIYNTDEFVLSALQTTFTLLKMFIRLYQPLPSAAALFASIKSTLSKITEKSYPDSLQKLLDDVRCSLSTLEPKSLEYVCRERKKPKVLRLYEPSIEENFEAGKKKSTDKVAAEKQKLKHQYKKELKATIREVRKDRAFIADQTIKERISRDAERQKKTNQIIADLQGQQHEVNMFEKMNRKVKRK